MSPQTLLLAFIFWESLYYLSIRLIANHLSTSNKLAKLIPSSDRRALFLSHLPAYLISTLHALQATLRGLHHLYRLRYAPTSIQLILTPFSPTHPLAAAETLAVRTTNTVLAAYLLTDLHHVCVNYPSLAGLDTILHHLAFLLCALIAGTYGLYPHTFAWLIIGEASTPFLNARWALIKLGLGATRAFRVLELLFVSAFVITRFFVYAVGLIHHFSTIAQTPTYVPLWARWTPTVFFTAAFGLNLVWMVRMYKLAFAPRAKRAATTRTDGKDE